MVDFKRLADRAKELVEKRGGTEGLKQDASELMEIAKSKGSVKDKAKAAVEALKEPNEGEGAPAEAKAPQGEAAPAEPAGQSGQQSAATPQPPAGDSDSPDAGAGGSSGAN